MNPMRRGVTRERSMLDRRMVDLRRESDGLIRGTLATCLVRRTIVSANLLPNRSMVQCRILQADVDAGLADVADIGLFWHTPGYSRVGGPDKVRP